MFVRARGMGIYPNQPCFDPTRPAWVPYWVDTPSESGCKWGTYPTVTTLAPVPTPPGAAPPGAPQTVTEMKVPGAFTPQQSADEAAAASQANWIAFFDTIGGQKAFGGDGGSQPGQCDPTAQSWLDTTTWCPSRWLTVAALAFAGGVVILPLLAGRR